MSCSCETERLVALCLLEVQFHLCGDRKGAVSKPDLEDLAQGCQTQRAGGPKFKTETKLWTKIDI